MMALVIALILVAIVAAILKLGLVLVRRYQARYIAYAEAADEFYVAADRLVDNANTPDDVLDFVALMNESINFPNAALFFVRLMQKRHGKPRGNPALNLRTMPQDVVADFVIAFDAWINAMAYRSMFWGPIFKALLDTPSVESKARDVVALSHKRELTAT